MKICYDISSPQALLARPSQASLSRSSEYCQNLYEPI
ncbi:hypothetical protein TGAM01_v202741 [Trichoderma gamsii]|uniref:Uncharacterized protein n=1 Tax=Trichoderma gamsii TaxID=398673 RepID=A0A2P4ZVC9_9HYPO|nr:hypothetical protein TGAM01_v202741 [Trichoderma gamsii]PON28247.1 hypothetical protein TGAM01_v202741 [Trichoderma gamsii]